MKKFQAIRKYSKGMISVMPLGKSFYAKDSHSALRIAREKYGPIPGTTIQVWEKHNL